MILSHHAFSNRVRVRRGPDAVLRLQPRALDVGPVDAGRRKRPVAAA